MPLEANADNLQITSATAFVTGDFSNVERFWDLLQQYADYLVAHGLDPEFQASSDDYEGPSTHNANLAVKSILGIAAFASLCDRSHRACGASYMATARRYAQQWATLAAGGRGGASVREYGIFGSWSQKYNLIWDRIFGSHLFDKAIQTECAFYLAPNSSVRQVYGWLLEDRSENESLHLANLGWSEWTAALCGVTAESDLYPVLIIKCSVLPVLPILAHTTQCSLLSVLITKCYHY